MTNLELKPEDSKSKLHVLYRMYDNRKRLLYIGRTIGPPMRLRSHRGGKDWWRDIARIQLEQFPDEFTLHRAEKEAIQTERPKHNITYIPKPPKPKPPKTTPTQKESESTLHSLNKIARARHRAERQLDRATDGETDAIVTALKAGHWHSEIATAVDRSREYVRRIANAHSIPGRYPRRNPPAGEPDGTAAVVSPGRP